MAPLMRLLGGKLFVSCGGVGFNTVVVCFIERVMEIFRDVSFSIFR